MQLLSFCSSFSHFRPPVPERLSDGRRRGVKVFLLLCFDFPRAFSFVGAPPSPRTSDICECGRICKVIPRNAHLAQMLYRSCRASGEHRKAAFLLQADCHSLLNNFRVQPCFLIADLEIDLSRISHSSFSPHEKEAIRKTNE